MGHEHRNHQHEHAAGALIQGPRRYEWVAAVGMLGRRRQVYDGLVALSGVGPGDRVLDVGCGTGYLSRRTARAVGPDGQVVGVDPSPSVVAYAAERAPVNCSFQVASAQSLPHPDASFDVVVSSLAIHHLPPDDRVHALREMRRVLRPGGRMFLVDFRQEPSHSRLGNFLSRRVRRHHSMADLAELVKQADLRITASGDRWPALHYVLGEAADGSPGTEGSSA